MADTPHDENIQRARIALEGLSVGDSIGGFFEFSGATSTSRRIAERSLPGAPWHFTDDTMMALSIVSVLGQYQAINQDALANSLAEHYERSRGYGLATRHVLSRIQKGEAWKQVAADAFKGTGSFGNGAAVRTSPIGAYFAHDLDAVVEQARLSSEVTHAHPEGIAGAIAVAVGAAWASRLRNESNSVTRQDFLAHILSIVPDSAVKEGIQRAHDLASDTTVQTAVAALGNGTQVSCQDTVPFALWCAGERLNNYEDAIWLTLQGLGDADTNCAIVGGIVSLRVGIESIPSSWYDSREVLPAWAFQNNS